MTISRRTHLLTRSDVGASAVEFALLFPIFMVLAMGTIAAGTAFSKQITVTQAAREASRYGATYDMTSPSVGINTWLADVASATMTAAGNQSDPLGGYDYYCVAYVVTTPAGTVDASKSKHLQMGGSPTAGACPSATAPTITSTDFVQVALTRNTQFFVLFANPNLRLDSVSLTPYEGKAP
jgi:Flp pilus assembly protein TadG